MENIENIIKNTFAEIERKSIVKRLQRAKKTKKYIIWN